MEPCAGEFEKWESDYPLFNVSLLLKLSFLASLEDATSVNCKRMGQPYISIT